MSIKTICTISGIRPDFIRMSEIFKKLDDNFNHVLVHTGQHFDMMLSDIFFKDLNIRTPDFNLKIGGQGKEHYHQSAELSVKLLNLLSEFAQRPDLIVFLGDSNSVTSAIPLKKEGYTIAHIEAGMRSGDKRMLEEINRTVCDHCSDYHFVYHEHYKQNLISENLPAENIYVVGNTIVEVFDKHFDVAWGTSKNEYIVLDIHRPENFKYKERLQNIIFMAQHLSDIYGIPVYMLDFRRTTEHLFKHGIKLGAIQLIDLMSYKEFLNFQYHSLFIISDSGTAQEEPALMNKPVVVPRDFTERPESVVNHCSMMVNVNDLKYSIMHAPSEIVEWLDHKENIMIDWLGKGNTSDLIINQLKKL